MGKYAEFEAKMEKAISFLLEEFGTIRAGKASAAVLDKISVEYYGSQTPINQVGNISVPEPRMLVIQPWDASMVKEIEKAILKSELGITPTNDGKSIRLVFPALTEERRRELVKMVGKKAEEAKVVIRGIRRDAIESYKKMQKNSEITEDDLKTAEKEIQDLTDKFVKKVDEEGKKKEKEIIEI
ncbi:MAG: ribosome recycling factor [Clostridia bacterium]|nr:ribosome recycling factor [Clostridia bacterium]